MTTTQLRATPEGADLHEAAARVGLTLAVSLLAAPSEDRLATAARAWHRGGWAHADVIDGRFGSRESVTLPEIRAVAGQNPAYTDVHLMVDEPTAWIARLPSVGRITVQLHGALTPVGSSLASLEAAARDRATAVWWAVDQDFATNENLRDFIASGCLGSQPDGLLVMLTPPGQPGHSLDETRLADVRIAHAAYPRVGVDGGVGAAHLPAIAAAGATYAVCGRSMFPSSAAPDSSRALPQSPAPSPLDRNSI